MGRIGRWAALAAVAGMLLLPLACSPHHFPTSPPPNAPLVRVRLLAGRDTVTLRATQSPLIKTASEKDPLRLNLPPKTDIALTLAGGQWKIGEKPIPGSGILGLQQAEDATVAVNGHTYRGRFRFVPTGANTFDVVNDVDVESYLKGVITREMPYRWNAEALEAQAIVARTYALYEVRMAKADRQWDVYPDDRSQMYGGYESENSKSRAAVEDSTGIVVAYGAAGHQRIFKAYFNSCCGGVTQSSADAFNMPYVVPLCDQNVHGLCNASDKYNWGPVEIKKDELTRRLNAYLLRRPTGHPTTMAAITKLEIQQVNRFDRPIRFVATDASDQRYVFGGEELRIAINAGATADAPAKLYSSFVKVINEPGSDVVRFVEGHGRGHGVGMCQYCSEARAEAGVRHEDIVLAAYPRAKLVRAY